MRAHWSLGINWTHMSLLNWLLRTTTSYMHSIWFYFIWGFTSEWRQKWGEESVTCDVKRLRRTVTMNRRFDPERKKRSQKTSNRPQARGWAKKVFVDQIPDTKWAEEGQNAPCSSVHELYWLLLMLCASSTARLLLVRARVRVCVSSSIYLNMEISAWENLVFRSDDCTLE